MSKTPALTADILRAAEILDREARVLAFSYKAGNRWPARTGQTKKDHDEMRRIARRLRRMAGKCEQLSKSGKE